MRERLIVWTISMLGLASGLLAALGCGSSTTSPRDASASSTALVPVSIVHPQRKALQRIVQLPGTLQAYEETLLFARVPGYVRVFYDAKGRLMHDRGQRIRGPKYDPSGKTVIEPGEILAELVVPELEQEGNLKRAMIRQAEAEVDQAKKLVAAADANVATMQATVVEAKAQSERWESESKRIAGLVRSGTLNEQSRDETLNQFKAAAAHLLSSEAAVRKATADRDKAMADVRSADARVDVAKADALRSEAMLGYSKIRAPFDGVVIERKANTGDLVQPTGGQSDWLFKVARLDPVRVVLAMPEADAELIKENAEVRISVPASVGPTLIGLVARTSWALESLGRTLRVEIDLPNKDGRLRPGMYVEAQIVNQLPEGWTLPASAVTKQGNATVCFIVEKDRLARTPVQIGRSDGQFVEVLKRQTGGSPPMWEDPTGNEAVGDRAAVLTDGQTMPRGTSNK